MCFIKRRDQLGDHRKIWSSESLLILHLPGQYISWFSLNFQCRMRLEHEGSVLPHFHIVPASLLDCSDCNWMKMQVHFWENAQVTHHCHLASSSSSQSSASWMDCQLFLLAQVLAVQDLHHGLLLRDLSESQVVKVPRQSEELAEMTATVTAKRHHPPVD